MAVTVGASNAKSVGDLAGVFGMVSATSAEVGGATVNAFAGRSPHGVVYGGEIGLTMGAQDSGMIGENYSTPIAGFSCP